MTTQQRSRVIALFVWAAALVWSVVPGLSTSTPAIAQEKTDIPRTQPPGRTPRPAGAGEASQARRIARERYQFLKPLEPRLALAGLLPIFSMVGDYENDAIFPVGRADRAYIFFWGYPYQSVRGAYIFCFQRKGGQEELVYRITLDTADRPAKKVKRIRSLLDFIHSSGDADSSYVLPRGVSQFARKDLAARREYAMYSCEILSDEYGPLEVGLLSDVTVTGDADITQKYALDRDPVTHAELDETPDEFFEKYGLPVSRKEMALIRDGRK